MGPGALGSPRTPWTPENLGTLQCQNQGTLGTGRRAETWYNGDMPRLAEPHEIPPLVRHTWDEWADGQWRVFFADQDFPGQTPAQFYGAAKKYALRHGLAFSGRVQPDRVLIQMWPKEAATDDRGGDTTAPESPAQ